jgi:hypothetical protein
VKVNKERGSGSGGEQAQAQNSSKTVNLCSERFEVIAERGERVLEK